MKKWAKMKAIVEFKFFNFNRNSQIFSINYSLFENKSLLFASVEEFELVEFKKLLDCYNWFKKNLYKFYQEMDIDIPFELIEFKFQKNLKKMGINPYEF